jgi:hypothetical protein
MFCRLISLFNNLCLAIIIIFIANTSVFANNNHFESDLKANKTAVEFKSKKSIIGHEVIQKSSFISVFVQHKNHFFICKQFVIEGLFRIKKYFFNNQIRKRLLFYIEVNAP